MRFPKRPRDDHGEYESSIGINFDWFTINLYFPPWNRLVWSRSWIRSVKLLSRIDVDWIISSIPLFHAWNEKKEREFRSLWEETRGRGERGNERKAWNSQFDVYILLLPKWSSLLVYSWWINHSVFEYLRQCRYSEVFRFCLHPLKGVSTSRVSERRERTGVEIHHVS